MAQTISFYPHTLCIGVITEDEPPKEADLAESNVATLKRPGEVFNDGQMVRFRSSSPGLYGFGASLFVLWHQPQGRWLAFAVSHIVSDMVDETNYSYARSVNSVIWKLLLETFHVPEMATTLERRGTISPVELRALAHRA